MLRKELLDARKALRSVRGGASGPGSKKQRGEWELVPAQWVVASFNGVVEELQWNRKHSSEPQIVASSLTLFCKTLGN